MDAATKGEVGNIASYAVVDIDQVTKKFHFLDPGTSVLYLLVMVDHFMKWVDAVPCKPE